MHSTDEQRTFPKDVNQTELEKNSTETITFGLTAEETVQEIRHRIYLATHLTASAGIACNMRLAKLCSDINKPNGQYRLESNVNVILNFIRNLPIRKIKGIGKVTALHLQSLEIQTVNDIYLKRGILKLIEYSSTFDFLMRVCHGCGSTMIEHDDIQKSIGHEITFNNTNDASQLISLCHDLAKKVVDELISSQIVCKRVTLKLKTMHFEILTRSKTLTSYTDSLNIITEKAIELLKNELEQDFQLPALRLMGVRVADLKAKSTNLPLLQFFSKSTTGSESAHDIVEDDEPPPSSPHHDNCETKFIDEDSNSNNSTTTCPVCQKMLLGDNDKINKHIDLCLNGEMIRTTIKEEGQRTSFSTQANKRIQTKTTPTAKRQKRNLNLSTTQSNGINNYFFKSDKCT